MIPQRRVVTVPDGFPPTLVVVVDTEEEFEWGAGFRREANTVEAMAEIGRFQQLCDEFGIRPTYVVDYPVAEQQSGHVDLRRFQDEGRAIIGAHLHPWVNPPHEEETSSRNSYAGNLPPDLEATKLEALSKAIVAAFGRTPKVFKAGRYGIGPATAATLEQQGFEVDLSICPTMDFRRDGGPDFREFDARPFWFGASRSMLEIPVAGGYAGLLRRWHGTLRSRPARRLRLPGILSRLRLFETTRLTPEGVSLEANVRLACALRRDGMLIHQFSLHSPSLAIGHTSYARREADRDALIERCRRFFSFYLGEFGGRSRTPLEVKMELESGA